MDFATVVGLLIGFGVVFTLIAMGGSFSLFYDIHALIVIGGGCTAATIIRFPFGALMHGFPMGIKYAFTMRKHAPARADRRGHQVSQKSSAAAEPMALENVQVDDPFLAQGCAYRRRLRPRLHQATRSSATATTFSSASTRARRSTAPSATPLLPGA